MALLRFPGSQAFEGLPRLYWRLWFALLVNRLGTFVVPFLALFLGAERGLSPQVAGLVVAGFGAGSVCGGPIGGALADRVGRRTSIALGMTLSALAMGFLIGARGSLALALAVFALGLAHELPRPAMSAMVADLVPTELRPRAYAALYWAANLGFALASLLAGLAALASFTLLFAVDALTSLACAVLVLFTLPETRPARDPSRRSSALADVVTPFRDPAFVRFFLVSVLVALVFFQFHVAMPLDMRAHGVGAATYGALVAINGAMIVVLQPFAGPLSARLPRPKALALSATLNGAGFGLLGVARTPGGYALAIAVLTLGEILMAPLNSVVVAELAPPHLRGAYQGAFSLAMSVAACVAPAAGSFVLEAFGGGVLWTGCFALGLVAAASHLGSGVIDSRASSPEKPAGLGPLVDGLSPE